VAPKRDFFPDPTEWEAHIVSLIGESSLQFSQRASGNAEGKARHGSNSDLALYTLGKDVRVTVISTDRIFSTTPDEKLFQAVELAAILGESEKSRVVCAILHKGHFDLGVLRTPDSVQAIFQVGPEWDHALFQLLSFIKSRSPSSGEERKDLGPRWASPTLSPRAGEKETGRKGGRTRRIVERGGKRRTRRDGLFVDATAQHATQHNTPHTTQHAAHSSPHS
jgi:hypothetical protein